MRYNIEGENNQYKFTRFVFSHPIIIVKLNPKHNMITPTRQVVTIGQLNSQIKGIKNALKQPELYSDDEIRLLKRSLRELYTERTELNKGNGFG